MTVLDRAIAANMPTEARVLVIDIEMRPGEAYWWQAKTKYIPAHMVIEKPSMICFDAKWLGQRNQTFRSVWDHGRDEMVAEARRLLDEAHIVIGYNSRGFDVPHINREIAQACQTAPSKHFDVDLIQTARRRFNFPYNSMNEVCRDLELELKLEHTGFDLWRDVMDGDPKARRLMEKYNRQDVLVCEGLYCRFRDGGWIDNHPNVNLFRAERVSGCATCGSDNVEHDGFHYTPTRAYARFLCGRCNSHSRATHHEPEMAQHRRSA